MKLECPLMENGKMSGPMSCSFRQVLTHEVDIKWHVTDHNKNSEVSRCVVKSSTGTRAKGKSYG